MTKMIFINKYDFMKISETQLKTLVETIIQEYVSKNNPQVERLVNKINDMLYNSIDKNTGDPLELIDKTSTWEEPIIYEPIIYQNGRLKITSYSPYKKDKNTEIIWPRDMEMEGVPYLKQIARMINSAIKREAKNRL